MWNLIGQMCDSQTKVCVFLSNGVKLQGIIKTTDSHGLTLERDGVTQAIFTHAIATVMPVNA